MTNKLLHLSKYLKEGKLLLVALVFVVSPCAESSWLAGYNAANSGNSLKQNLGKLIDILGETDSAPMEELWGEVKKVHADIIKDYFPVLKVGDVAAASWDGLTKKLKTAERKIHRFAGRVNDTVTDARVALTTDNDEWDWYKSEAPLSRPTVTNKTAKLTNNSGVAGWSNGNANSAWSDSNPMEAFRQSVLEEERQAKLEGDRLWAKELERRTQLAKEEECLGVCDEVENDDSQSDYASALAETIGETPVAAINQNSYQVELENLEAERQAQLDRERVEEERKLMARLEKEKKERQRQERQRQERLAEQEQERQERLAEQEQERQDRILAQRQRELDRQYKQQILNNIAQSLNNMADAYLNSTGGQTGSSRVVKPRFESKGFCIPSRPDTPECQ